MNHICPAVIGSIGKVAVLTKRSLQYKVAAGRIRSERSRYIRPSRRQGEKIPTSSKFIFVFMNITRLSLELLSLVYDFLESAEDLRVVECQLVNGPASSVVCSSLKSTRTRSGVTKRKEKNRLLRLCGSHKVDSTL